ncbi:MAG: hypothetical protein GXP55_07985, partial [Deltaproteobacteria bacterium]|nr:hypothetical protein [Deltaproteobacteria bacterium]
ATLRATPEGTAVVASARPKAWILDTAPSDAETRTRLPEPEPEAQPPVPSGMDTPTRRDSLGASQRASGATQGTELEPPQETATPADAPAPEATLDSAPEATLDSAPETTLDSAPEPDSAPEATPGRSLRRSSSLALLALLLFIALAIGAGIWLLSAGTG